MLWIIDGYNLMHAWKPIARDAPPPQFQRHRKEFLSWLAQHHSSNHSQDSVEVVFDAHDAPQPTPIRLFRGLNVIFTYKMHADHWIDERLQNCSNDNQPITVVSDDHRVQQTARRRMCQTMGCQEFLEKWMQPGLGLSKFISGIADLPEAEKRRLTREIEEKLLRQFEQPKKSAIPAVRRNRRRKP